MNEQIYLKKIDESLETVIRRKSNTFNLEMLINFIINKLNNYNISEEQSSLLESILLVFIFFI
jgi:hypothetical protein